MRGINYAVFSYMNRIIEEDPVYMAGEKPERAPFTCIHVHVSLWPLKGTLSGPLKNREIDHAMDDMGLEGLGHMDPYDVVWRNRGRHGP